jgi:8-oxo-dGTP diphosphatase
VAASIPIPVVCALIEREGCILLAQRPAHKHLPLKWEFPGGKVEPGEDPAAAIVREIREELGCDIIITQSLPRFIHRYERVTIKMIPFVCRLANGTAEPHPHEHVAVVWLKSGGLLDYDLAAADLPVMKSYRLDR